MRKKNNIKKKSAKKLSPQELAIIKEQKAQRNEISNILKNIGFSRLTYIDGKHFEYDNRKSEMDDIFVCENIILIVEYTIYNPQNEAFRHFRTSRLFS